MSIDFLWEQVVALEATIRAPLRERRLERERRHLLPPRWHQVQMGWKIFAASLHRQKYILMLMGGFCLSMAMIRLQKCAHCCNKPDLTIFSPRAILPALKE